jgi:NADH-quinone oxidoreductase subunit N
MSLSTFAAIMYASTNNAIPKYLLNWTAVAQRNFCFALSFVLILFSIAGIPPLAGFYSKMCILLSLVGYDHTALALITVLFSSIACFYYIRLIKIFFFTKGGNNNFWSGAGTRNIELFLGLGTSVIVLFLARPMLLNSIATLVAISLI